MGYKITNVVAQPPIPSDIPTTFNSAVSVHVSNVDDSTGDISAWSESLMKQNIINFMYDFANQSGLLNLRYYYIFLDYDYYYDDQPSYIPFNGDMASSMQTFPDYSLSGNLVSTSSSGTLQIKTSLLYILTTEPKTLTTMKEKLINIAR